MFCAVERPMCVVTDVTFSYREPPSKSKKTVAEIRKMSARQRVRFCFYIVAHQVHERIIACASASSARAHYCPRERIKCPERIIACTSALLPARAHYCLRERIKCPERIIARASAL